MTLCRREFVIVGWRAPCKLVKEDGQMIARIAQFIYRGYCGFVAEFLNALGQPFGRCEFVSYFLNFRGKSCIKTDSF